MKFNRYILVGCISQLLHNSIVRASDHEYNESKSFQNHNTKKRGLRVHRIHGENKDYESFEEWAHSKEFQEHGDRCSSRQPTEEEKDSSAQVFRKWLDTHPCDGTGGAGNPLCKDSEGKRRLEEVVPVTVQVYFHVIRRGNGAGGVTEDQILDSIDVLNAAYGPDFSFVFDIDKDVDYHNDSNMYNGVAEMNMKTKLHKGDCSSLNIYSLKPSTNILGWANFPWECEREPTGDGVVILEDTLPGGSARPYNLGHTLVHEVGHWLGLFHTFEEGCLTITGEVHDTPPEASPAFGCPVGRDSCGSGGLDPINNFMDYSDDSCMEQFTEGQFARMLALWDDYRKPQPQLVCKDGEANIQIKITTDEYGQETSWSLKNACTDTVVQEGGPYDGMGVIDINECVSDEQYIFEIRDSYGDGMCCEYGDGSFMVKYKGNLEAGGGEDFSEETATFGSCPMVPEPSNGQESKNDKTSAGTWERIFYDEFESDDKWGHFNSGGDDARYHGRGVYSHSGEGSLYVRDDEGEKAAIFTNPIDVSYYDSLKINFWFYPWHMESNDGFVLEFSTDDNYSFTEHKRWTMSDGLRNNRWYAETSTIDVDGVNSIKIRFRCAANVNKDKVFFDDIEVLGRTI